MGSAAPRQSEGEIVAIYIPFEKKWEDDEVAVYAYQDFDRAHAAGEVSLVKATGETRPLGQAIGDGWGFPNVAAKLYRLWAAGEVLPEKGSYSA